MEQQTWYYRLLQDKTNPNAKYLFKYHPLATLQDRLVVCLTPESYNGTRFYTVFKSYIEYFLYFTKTAPKDRCFYEIILGSYAQKPHFDIDISDGNLIETAKFVLDHLIESIISVLSEVGIELNLCKDLLIFSSNSNEKFSYHIVLDNFAHGNNKEAQAFYQEVMQRYKLLTDGKHSDCIDPKVYSPHQNFRILGCHKAGSTRYKTFDTIFSYKGQVYQHTPETFSDPQVQQLDLVRKSLITFTAGCRFLPSWVKERPRSMDITSLSEQDVNDALQQLEEKFPHCFTFSEERDGIIVLKREQPSFCPVCQRVHEKENAFMFVRDYLLYWSCRRSDRFYHLGFIITDNEEIFETPNKGDFVLSDVLAQKPNLSLSTDLSKPGPISEPPAFDLSRSIQQLPVLTPDISSGLNKISYSQFLKGFTSKLSAGTS